MDWTRSDTSVDTSSVDTWVSQNIYGTNFSNSEGIDLRVEMHTILYGNLGRKPKGHWIVLRQFDRTQRSAYYNKRTHEGVNGPAFTYTDTLLRTRRVPVAKRSDDLTIVKVGADIGDNYVYYFEYNVNPRIGDHIFELYLNDHTNRPASVASSSFMEKYVINRIHPYRLENGNVQYWSIIAERDEVTY